MKFTDFKALTFDCYGTLIDWETGMIEALKPLTSKVGRTLSRNEVLSAHALCQRRRPAPCQRRRPAPCHLASPGGYRSLIRVSNASVFRMTAANAPARSS